MRARYMDPATGRFLSEDPAKDGNNWFVYCRNDPIGYSDPTGEFGMSVIGFAGMMMTYFVSAFLYANDMKKVAVLAWVAGTAIGFIDYFDAASYIIHRFNEILGPIREQQRREMEKDIYSMKTSGSLTQAFAASQIEQLLWTETYD